MKKRKNLGLKYEKAGEKIEIEVQLSDRQKGEIEKLLMECENKEQKKLDFFMEQEWNERSDCPCFFLLYIKEEKKIELVCVVSAFIIEGEAELSAVTQIEKRGKGLFSRLLHIVFSVLVDYGVYGVSIRIEDKNNRGREILEHWGWKKGETDCLMVLLPEQIERLQQFEKKEKREIKCLEDIAVVENWKELIEVHASAFGCLWKESEWTFKNNFSEGMKLWTYWIEGRVVGVCFVMETEQSYFLSAVSIQKEQQHQGHGEWFLQSVLIQLWKQKKKEVLLQIFGENYVAIQLYQKLGFSFRQKLDTYFLKLK